jgi:hypothetical protein
MLLLAVVQMQAAARAAAVPLPPVVLPPANAAMADLTPAVRLAPAAAASSPVAAAAVANLGLQLPSEGTAMVTASDAAATETAPLLEQGTLMSGPCLAGGLSDDTSNEIVLAQA